MSKNVISRTYACALFISILSGGALPTLALEPLPFIPPSPTPPIVVRPIPTPLPTPPPAPVINPDESIPVVVDYGEGKEVRVGIYGGVMEPVGFLPEQVAKVTLTFPTSWAGAPVTVGRLDGGVVGVPTSAASGIVPSLPNEVTLTVPIPIGGAFQFNFQAGRTHGLYRVMVSVGNTDYLLRFYVGTPASGASVPELPTFTPAPPPSTPPPQ